MTYPDPRNLNLRTRKGFPDPSALCESVSVILQSKSLHPKVIQHVLDGALWWIADFSGKEFECPFRSIAADDICRSTNDRRLIGKGLVHEHIIPKNLIRAELMRLRILPDTIKEINVERLLRLSVYCLVDRKADDKKLNRKKMPNENWKLPTANVEDIWARYIDAKIDVIDMRTNPKWKGAK